MSFMNKSYVSSAIKGDSNIAVGTLAPFFSAEEPPQYVTFKAVFDKSIAAFALPIVALIALMLVILNPFSNPGPVFYRQDRMGHNGRRFRIWKFRTMTHGGDDVRHHSAPLEQERITPLGRFLRRTRIDELPNFINVIKGDMSVIGPRPDAWDHATTHIETVRYYACRFAVRPGITGLAQIKGGYADHQRAIERKARLDLFYVKNCSTSLDLYIALRTAKVVITGFGAK